MAMPQCCYLAKGAKRPSHTTNTIKFDCIPFDPCNSIKSFDLSPFDQKNSTYLQPPVNNNTYERCIYMFERYKLERNTISGTTHRTSPFHMIGTHVIVVKLCSSQIFQIYRKCMFEFFQRPIEVSDFICK